ncbi:MAG: hypothetical protein K2X39_06285 [Silvanigrellaceae bacterium]|nr:hypothetical protein [Silvanigrellaceae bacterium]
MKFNLFILIILSACLISCKRPSPEENHLDSQVKIEEKKENDEQYPTSQNLSLHKSTENNKVIDTFIENLYEFKTEDGYLIPCNDGLIGYKITGGFLTPEEVTIEFMNSAPLDCLQRYFQVLELKK